ALAPARAADRGPAPPAGPHASARPASRAADSAKHVTDAALGLVGGCPGSGCSDVPAPSSGARAEDRRPPAWAQEGPESQAVRASSRPFLSSGPLATSRSHEIRVGRGRTVEQA